MKKRLMLALMLILCAALLCSCGDKKKYDVGTAQNQGNQQNQQTQQNLGNQPAVPEEDGMNPLAEEDDYTGDSEYWGEELPTQKPVEFTPAPTIRSEYAGATPVVIDPIDKPTPTPVPPLMLDYATYDATNIGLSFEGPAGWAKAESSNEFTIQNPTPKSIIDYPATLTLRAEKVSSEYTTNDLKTIINGMLDAIETVGFEDYSPSQTANRELLGKTGVYANYSGVLLDGTKVSGRVHAVCVDKVLYTLHLSTPQAQWNDYKEMVYDKLRETLTIVK